jgi:hypothetical protein
MTRLFNLAAGMGLPSARYARFGQAHTGDLQKRRYTTNTTSFSKKRVGGIDLATLWNLDRNDSLKLLVIGPIDFGESTRGDE